MSEAPIIFVSCGQWTEAERTLGRDVCNLIRKHAHCEPYFAQNQSDLEGLTTNILGALDRAVGFLAIMHRRRSLHDLEGQEVVRGSVWIEQEIAIAAYLRQVLKRPLGIRLFLQPGIALEGIRQQLVINPTLFTNGDEVLAALPEILRQWNPARSPARITNPVALKILEWKEQRLTITVKPERPKGPQALLGNPNWKGTRECQIEQCDDFTVHLNVLGYGLDEALALEQVMITHDTAKHRPMLIVKA